MIKVFFLIFETALTWDRIALARRSVAKICFLNLIPFILFVCVVEGIGLRLWGRIHPDIKRYIDFSMNDVLLYEFVQFTFSVVGVFVCARLIQLMGDTFRSRSNFENAFTVTAYGLAPMFLLRLLDAFPQINPWATWGVGIALSIAVLYQGMPRIMAPDPTHAFGLYFSSSFILIMITGLGRMVTAIYLVRHIRHIGAHIKHYLPGLHF